jgi:hypothetical protein
MVYRLWISHEKVVKTPVKVRARGQGGRKGHLVPVLGVGLGQGRASAGKDGNAQDRYQVSFPAALASCSYFSMVRLSTAPVRNKSCPPMVDFPASTCPANIMFKWVLMFWSTASSPYKSRMISAPAAACSFPRHRRSGQGRQVVGHCHPDQLLQGLGKVGRRCRLQGKARFRAWSKGRWREQGRAWEPLRFFSPP